VSPARWLAGVQCGSFVLIVNPLNTRLPTNKKKTQPNEIGWAGGMAQLVESWPSMLEALSSDPRMIKQQKNKTPHKRKAA
jgi:hypothetical protein